MLTLPAADGSDDEWFEFAQARTEDLLPHLRELILERFTYKSRYVQQKVWRSFATASARSRHSISTFGSSQGLMLTALGKHW
ncbi:hypothetical protein D3C77_699080 [compost metagenome]